MQQRQQVQYAPNTPDLKPAASVTDSFYAPRLPKAALQPVTDLSPLSRALTEIVVDQQRVAAESAVEVGKKAALDANQELLDRIGSAGQNLTDAEQRRKANQDAYAKEVAAGNLPEAANPWVRASFMETSARRVMDAYRNDLQTQLDQVSTVIDPATGLPSNPQSPQEIISKTWAKYSNNGVFGDWYAQRTSNKMREQIDASFNENAGAAVAQAMNSARKEQLANELGEQFTKWSLAPNPPTAQDVAAVEQFINVQARQMGVSDPRELVMRSVKFAASSADYADKGEGSQSEASRLLRSVRDIKVGPTTLGKDVKSGTELSQLIKEFDALHERKQSTEYERVLHEKALAINDGESQLLKILQDERAKGDKGNVTAAGQRFLDGIQESQPWGAKVTPFVVEQGRHTLNSFANEPIPEDKQLVDSLYTQLFAGKNLQSFQADAQALVASKQIGGTTYGNLMALYTQRTNLTPLLDSNPVYTSALAELERSAKLEGFPADVQAKYQDAQQQELDDFRGSASRLAQGAAGTPDAANRMRDGLEALKKDSRARLETMVAGVRKEHDDRLVKINDLLAHSTDATGEIESASKVLSADERVRLQDISNRASDRTRFYNLEPYRAAEQAIEQKTAEIAAVELGDKAKGGVAQDLSRVYQRQLKGKFDAWLAENAPKIAPGQLSAAAGSALQEMTDELVGKIGGSQLDKVILGVEAGKSAKDIGEGLQQIQQHRANYVQAASSALPQAAQVITGAGRHPLVPSDVYELQRQFLARESAGVITGTAGVHGVPTRAAVENSADVSVRDILAQGGIADNEKAAAAVSVYKNIGIPAQQVLDGELLVQPNAAWQARASAAIARYQALGEDRLTAAGELSGWASAQQIKDMVDLPPAKVSLKGADLDPFNTPYFSSRDELREWYEQHPVKLNRLLERLGVSKDGPEKTEWIKAQMIAIERTHPTNG